jgi:subtilase family serine protease
LNKLGMAVSALAAAAAVASVGAPAALAAADAQGLSAQVPLKVKTVGRLSNGDPLVTRSTPTGLPPSQVAAAYGLSGLSAVSTDGSGQIIAIVDAYNDAGALADLNRWNTQYGYPALSTCTSLTQSGACFEQAYPQGKPAVNSGWALEQSLDIEWAHAEAPGAKIVLVDAANSSDADLFGAVQYANKLGATEVSMSWAGSEFSGEKSYDSAYLNHAGTFYTASAGDSGHEALYPASSPNVIAVGGTTLNGCSGLSCTGFSSETTWSGSGGGASSVEGIPSFQSSYGGPVFGAASIAALTGSRRGVPDVSFDANPNTGVSVYDSTSYEGQSGWFTLGGTSVGAPNWAGILAAGRSTGATALEGDAAIFGGGYETNLRDVASGTNGSCGTKCTAGTGYDLVTGLGSPINYP